MEADVLAASIAVPTTRIHLRVAWLCGVVLFLEGYDIAAAGYAIPALVDAWKVPTGGLHPSADLRQCWNAVG